MSGPSVVHGPYRRERPGPLAQLGDVTTRRRWQCLEPGEGCPGKRPPGSGQPRPPPQDHLPPAGPLESFVPCRPALAWGPGGCPQCPPIWDTPFCEAWRSVAPHPAVSRPCPASRVFLPSASSSRFPPQPLHILLSSGSPCPPPLPQVASASLRCPDFLQCHLQPIWSQCSHRL